MASLISYFVLCILCYFLYRYKYRRIFALTSKLARIGTYIPILGNYLSLVGNPEQVMQILKQYSKNANDHGGIGVVWLGHLLYYTITDPVLVEYILKNILEKDKIHRFSLPLNGNAMIFAPVSTWKPRRKVAVPMFSPKIITTFVDVFAKQSVKLVTALKPLAGTGNFKIWPQINAYNLDSVMETGIGVSLNAQDNHNNEFIVACNEAMSLCCQRVFRPWLHPDWLYRFFPQHRKLKRAIKIVHEFTDEVIERKKSKRKQEELLKTNEAGDEHQNTKPSFLDVLLSQTSGIDGHTNLELREEVLTFIIAATDTSAVAIGYTLKLLGKYPAVQQKVVDELDVVYGDSDRLLIKDDLPRLQYLERVIKESLRLYPSVPYILRTTTQDTPINESITIPKGAGIGIGIYGIHRNPNIWGPDADAFDPDRFLPDRMKGMHPCSFIPFSHGPRNCLGYQYAMMSMKTALSAILRQYKVVCEPEIGPVPNIRVRFDTMMKAVDGFEVALELR